MKKKKTIKKVKGKKAKAPVKKLERVGILGGTFNPIHFGHLGCAETVKEVLKLSKLYLIPAQQNPLREPMEGPSPEARLKMVQLALTTLGGEEKGFFASDMELQRGGLSYTIETINQLKKENKNYEIFLIVGADQIDSLHKWKSVDKIFLNANLVLTSRPGFSLPEKKSEFPMWLAKKIKSFSKGKGKLSSGKAVICLQLNDQNISASEIRRRARRGEDVSNSTPIAVNEYIKEHKLYASAGSKLNNFEELTKFCARILTDKGGINIAGYNVKKLAQPTEFALVSSGTSTRHTKALAENVVRAVKNEYGIYPQATEGTQESRWVVLDYGALMVHLFYDYVRSEYRIEDLWRQGEKISL
jgi:nicotinate-nucleotide adenylyltransferase